VTDRPVTEIPVTQYAWNGDVALAYQVVGDGPVDLLYVQGYASHIDLNWGSPALAAFLTGLADNTRLIITDRRGWGCSDRFSPWDIPPIEAMVDDLLAVLDAAGSERAVLFGSLDTGLVAALFAATHPGRLLGLVLCDSLVTYIATDDTPWMFSHQAWMDIAQTVHDHWARPEWSADWVMEPVEREWYTRWQGAAAAPGAFALEVSRHLGTDLRTVFPALHVPTLVVTTTGEDTVFSRENGRWIASTAPNARLVELPSGDGPWFHWYGRRDALLAEIANFVAGIWTEQRRFDRVLSSVLFTDIVNSTAVSSKLGDAGWQRVLEAHHRTIRALLARLGGKEVNTTGDGFFATFDGPGRAVSCAMAITMAVQQLGIEVRAGVHTGEVEYGGGSPEGIAVTIGARICAEAAASEVLASSTVKDLVSGSGLVFEDAGERVLKGVEGSWRLFRLLPDSSGFGSTGT
jgi:class 3 adenylate cyclase